MMAIGERIRFFRNLRGMTQKYLGTVVGFPEKTADIRMASAFLKKQQIFVWRNMNQVQERRRLI